MFCCGVEVEILIIKKNVRLECFQNLCFFDAAKEENFIHVNPPVP